MLPDTPYSEPRLPVPLFKRGKVRDVYDLGKELLLVATDRISAFDCVLSPGIPGKGIVLTQLSNFWFERFPSIQNHLLETDFDRFPDELKAFEELRGRSIIVRKCEVIPVECVARGYLTGSGLKDYVATGAVCGIPLPAGMVNASRIDEPIFTPATKAESGHDENISVGMVEDLVGEELTERLREVTLRIYREAASYALSRGIIIADTKFEFGLAHGELVWIDEALTPDSSRFWPASGYKAGISPPSYDKQFVRDWLETTTWDKTPPAPELPGEVVQKTLEKYLAAYETLTGRSLAF